MVQSRPAPAQSMTTSEATVASLIAHGIDTIYALARRARRHSVRGAFKAGDRDAGRPSRHEQGAAYMALGAALATDKPSSLCRRARTGPAQHHRPPCSLPIHQCAGAGVDRQIPNADIGRGLGHIRNSQPGRHNTRLVDFGDRFAGPARRQAGRGSRCDRWVRAGQGPAALQCAIDIWGRRSRTAAVRRSPAQPPCVDENAIARRPSGSAAAKRPMIVCGGGAQDA